MILIEWIVPIFDMCYNIGIISFNFYKMKAIISELSLKNINLVVYVLCMNQCITVRTTDVFNTPKKYLLSGSGNIRNKWLLYDFNINFFDEYGLKFGHLFKIEMNDKMNNDQNTVSN